MRAPAKIVLIKQTQEHHSSLHLARTKIIVNSANRRDSHNTMISRGGKLEPANDNTKNNNMNL